MLDNQGKIKFRRAQKKLQYHIKDKLSRHCRSKRANRFISSFDTRHHYLCLEIAMSLQSASAIGLDRLERLWRSFSCSIIWWSTSKSSVSTSSSSKSKNSTVGWTFWSLGSWGKQLTESLCKLFWLNSKIPRINSNFRVLNPLNVYDLINWHTLKKSFIVSKKHLRNKMADWQIELSMWTRMCCKRETQKELSQFAQPWFTVITHVHVTLLTAFVEKSLIVACILVPSLVFMLE